MKTSINRYAITLCLSLATVLHAQALTVSGVNIPESFSIGDKKLLLNGAGVREKMLMDMYIGSLYLPQKATDGDGIAAEDSPMAIRLDITSKVLTSERMTKATIQGFNNSTGGNTEPLKSEIETFISELSKPISVNDVFEFVYEPSIGTKIMKNGETLTVVKGLPFKKALFGIWLSPKPAQASLKQKMLGL